MVIKIADGSLNFDTSIDNKGFKDGIKDLKTLAENGINEISSVAKGAIDLTAKAVTAASAGLATAGGLAVKAGIEFESAFTGVEKTVDGTKEQLAELETSIRDMAKSMPQSASAIAGVAEAAGQLGIETDNISDFTKTMVQMGDATNLSSEEAATSLARLANITGMSQDKFSNLGSTIVALGNNLATTESEITAMALRLAGTGSQIGMSESQIMALAGGLSSVGIEAEAGGSAFSTLMSKIALAVEQGGKDLTNFSAVAGMSSEQFKAAFKDDAASAIMAFVEGLDHTEERGISAIKVLDDMGLTELRLKDALLRASGASGVFNKAMSISNTAWEENSALAKEAETRYTTMESQLSILKNKLTDIGISFYRDVKNPLIDIVKETNTMLDNLSNAFNQNGLQGLIESLGESLGQIIVKITDNIPNMISLASTLLTEFANAIVANTGVILEAAGEIVITLCDGITNNSANTVNAAIDLVSKLADTVISVAPYIGEAAIALLDALVTGLTDNLPYLIPCAVDMLLSLVEYVLDNIDLIVDLALNIIKSLADGLVNAIPVLTDKAPVIIQKLVDALVDNLPKILEFAVKLIAELVIGIMKNLPNITKAGEDIIRSLISGLLNLNEELKQTVRDMGDGAINEIKNLDWSGLGKFVIDQVLNGIANPSFVANAVSGGITGFFKDKIFGKDKTDKTDKTDKVTFGGVGRSFGIDNPNTGTAPFAPKLFEDDLTDYKKVMDEGIKAEEQTAKESIGIEKSYGDELVIAKKESKKKKEKEIVDGTARYAALEQDELIERSEEYIALQDEVAKQEANKLEESLKAKETIGVRGIQEAYNKWLTVEKTKVTEKEKAIQALENKLDKQKKALNIAQSTNDLKGAYKILKALEIELSADMSEEVKAQKLKDLENYSQEVKQDQLDALEESNSAKIELLKQGLEDEKTLIETYQDNYSSAFDGMVSSYEKAYQEISNKQDALTNKLKSFGDMFEKFTVEDVEYMKLGDLEGDVKQLQLLNAGIEALRTKGVSQQYIDEMLTNNSVEDSLDFIELLNSESQASLEKHLAMWEEKQRLSEQIASNIYKTEYETLKSDFTDKVAEDLGLMPEEAKNIGESTAKSLADGMLSKINDVKNAASVLVAKMQETVQAEMSSIGTKLSAESNVSQTVQTKDNGIMGALRAIYNRLGEETESTADINIDGKKVGEITADGVIREMIRRGLL